MSSNVIFRYDWPIKPQNLCPWLLKSSQSNFNLRLPDCYLVRSYLIITVLILAHRCLKGLLFKFCIPKVKTPQLKSCSYQCHNKPMPPYLESVQDFFCELVITLCSYFCVKEVFFHYNMASSDLPKLSPEYVAWTAKSDNFEVANSAELANS